MKRSFPQIFEASGVRPVIDYASHLLATLEHLAPEQISSPTVVVLTPGIYNSAYFEHSFLAQQMGVELVEGRDLMVHEGFVCMKTTAGPERVDVIYRRIDDDFLDPQAFRADSMLGIPGVIDVYRKGRVALANAPGTGVADDKVIYAYVEKMIRYYLAEDAIIPNVPTYVCVEEDQRRYVLEHLDELVVKAANESGGYGMLIGPHASPVERETVRGVDSRQPAQLHRSAHADAVPRPDHRGGPFRRPTRRPPSLYSLREEHLRVAGRPDPRGVAEGFAGG